MKSKALKFLLTDNEIRDACWEYVKKKYNLENGIYDVSGSIKTNWRGEFHAVIVAEKKQ